MNSCMKLSVHMIHINNQTSDHHILRESNSREERCLRVAQMSLSAPFIWSQSYTNILIPQWPLMEANWNKKRKNIYISHPQKSVLFRPKGDQLYVTAKTLWNMLEWIKFPRPWAHRFGKKKEYTKLRKVRSVMGNKLKRKGKRRGGNWDHEILGLLHD